MRRPIGMLVTTILLSISLIATLPIMLAGPIANHWSPDSGLTALTFHTILMALLALLILGSFGLVLWYYFHGYPWARWVVLLLCLVCFLPLQRLVDRVGTSQIRMAVILFRAATAFIVIFYMMMPTPREWFAHEPEEVF